MRLFEGFLRGMPKRITTTDYNELKHYDGLFLKVRVTEVGKERPFPVLSHLDKTTKTKNWTNNLVDKICFLDNTGLEDAVTVQDVKFEVIDGYYFDQGFNKQIKEQIEVIFNKRLEAKAAGNDGLQQAYKLLMNSSYGKLIEKNRRHRHPLHFKRRSFKMC